jgi:hypothetical protein
VQRRCAVLSERVRRQAGRQHYANGSAIIVSRSMSHLAAIGIGKTRDKAGIFGQQRFNCGLVGGPAGRKQFYVGRTSFHKQLEEVVVAELFGDVVRRHVPAERPLINGSTGLLIDHRRILVAYPHPNAVGIGVEMFADEIKIAKRRSHEDVRPAPALDQVARELLAVAYHVLRRRGFVIHVTGINVCAVVQ